jgi:Cu/Ag efflux pump CusA
VVVLAAALLVFGATQLRDMPVDVLPEFTPPRVEVQTGALGLSAARVQFPLEYHGPVLLTAVAIALALVPGAIPGHEIVQPMALVVLGSLVTATLLNLFVTSPST